MNTPFVFGKIATADNFTDRDKETALLISNFRSLINTIIISPRRWGKSSLVNRAAELAASRDAKLKICKIDLFNVRNEEHFYELLARSVLKAASTRWEDAVEGARQFFSRLVPKIVLAPEPGHEVSLSFDWDELKANPDEVLDLAERIAASKGVKLVVCIDEFQNIAEFDKTDHFQKKLRSHWQQHQNVAYCLYGSKRHMMLDVFTNSSMPFYKFGHLMFLEKIDTPSFVEFIVERFESTGKRISKELASRIVSHVKRLTILLTLTLCLALSGAAHAQRQLPGTRGVQVTAGMTDGIYRSAPDSEAGYYFGAAMTLYGKRGNKWLCGASDALPRLPRCASARGAIHRRGRPLSANTLRSVENISPLTRRLCAGGIRDGEQG